MEVAKMRAARTIYGRKLSERFDPKNPKSLAFRTHSQTSGWSLTEQDPFNNVVSTSRRSARCSDAAIRRALHTNALDEAIALPTDFSASIARNTQLFLQAETGLCQVVDPWGGSFYVESLTKELMHLSWKHIQEVEALGGMAKAIETGLPKLRIEEAAARRQALIDSGREVIVGVNKFRLEREDPMEILEVDNTAVRESQVRLLKKLKSERNPVEVRAALDALRDAARTKKGNLLELAVSAARVRATLGEISLTLEEVFSRYEAVTRSVSGVYSSSYGEQGGVAEVRRLAGEFEISEGRRPRILIAKMGQDGHDRGAKVVASAMADMGFDVDIGPLFQTPEETARQAVDNDVHVVAMSSLAGGHKTLLPQLVSALRELGRDDIMLVVGGVIPAQDYPFLLNSGAVAIFGPGSPIPDSARLILQRLKSSAKVG
jgi:methylmalonyl-CoA mutase